MTIVVNTKTFTADGTAKQDEVVHNGPTHSYSVRDYFTNRRAAPKATALYSGNSVGNVSLKRDFTLTGAVTAKAMGQISVNALRPVGAADADIDSMLSDMAAYITSAQFKALLKAGSLPS